MSENKETEYEVLKLSNEMTLKERIIHKGETADIWQTIAYLFLGSMFLYIAISFYSFRIDAWNQSSEDASVIMGVVFFIGFLIILITCIFNLVFIIRRKKIPVEEANTDKVDKKSKLKPIDSVPKIVLVFITLTLLYILVLESNNSPDGISPLLPIVIILAFSGTIFRFFRG